MTQPGVSFVVPVHNGERWLDEALTAILAQRDGRPFEIIAVDDGSSDAYAPRALAAWAEADGIRVLRAAKRGAAAAMNQGIREAKHPIICLVDQDVVLKPGWLAAILEPLSADPGNRPVWRRAGPLRHRPGRAARGQGGRYGPRAAVRVDRRRADEPRVHRQFGVSRGGPAQGRPLRRVVRLRLRQRHELPAHACGVRAAILSPRETCTDGARRCAATWPSSMARVTAGSTSCGSTLDGWQATRCRPP